MEGGGGGILSIALQCHTHFYTTWLPISSLNLASTPPIWALYGNTPLPPCPIAVVAKDPLHIDVVVVVMVVVMVTMVMVVAVVVMHHWG